MLQEGICLKVECYFIVIQIHMKIKIKESSDGAKRIPSPEA